MSEGVISLKPKWHRLAIQSGSPDGDQLCVIRWRRRAGGQTQSEVQIYNMDTPANVLRMDTQ